MITIDFLKNHSTCIQQLAKIWHEVLGKIWAPEITIELVIKRFSDHLNEDELPVTFVALDGTKPVGMCSLRQNDGIRSDLSPWLGSLVVDPAYQKMGVGKMLVEATQRTAKKFGYTSLYLFAFDQRIPEYYRNLGFNMLGMDEFKGNPVTVMQFDLKVLESIQDIQY